MTAAEWARIAQLIQARWPHANLPDATLAVWFDDLRELSAEAVNTVVVAFNREGNEFPPTSGQILARVNELNGDMPDHGEAYALAMKAASSKGFEAGLEWLRGQNELVALAAERFPWRSLCLEPMEDGTRRAQFRGIYVAVVERAKREQVYEGLPSGGLKALEKKNTEPRKLGDVVKEIGSGDAS